MNRLDRVEKAIASLTADDCLESEDVRIVLKALRAQRIVLKKCRDKFLAYEKQHLAKKTADSTVKAQVNRGMADLCDSYLPR